jgi:hypothetical protein
MVEKANDKQEVSRCRPGIIDRKRTDPEKVARTVLAALVAANPRHHYSVGYMSGAAAFLEVLPQSIADWILGKRF